MICKECGKDNSPLKKTCSNCGAFLEGRTINNVTGKWGYRTADGDFIPDKQYIKKPEPIHGTLIIEDAFGVMCYK